jgi:hypothetical protein
MGLEIDLATIDIKKETKTNFNASDIKIEIPTTFEIKVILITFVIKDEVEKLEEMEIMQEKPNLTNIPN